MFVLVLTVCGTVVNVEGPLEGDLAYWQSVADARNLTYNVWEGAKWVVRTLDAPREPAV
jgi:hypothetical protein